MQKKIFYWPTYPIFFRTVIIGNTCNQIKDEKAATESNFSDV